MFTDAFGGSTLQPAQVAYRAIALAANLALAWPAQSISTTDFAARMMDVTPSAPALAITMPPANAVGTGYDVLFTNKGAQTFTVKGNAGATLATVGVGAAVYLYITDNSTAAGVWATVAFGATTSAADAASLAGLGLAANATKLQASLSVAGISANRSIVSTDRAMVYVWTGGVGTITLPSAASMGTDFFFEVRNQGTGVLTIATTAEQIDASASIALQIGEAAFVHSGGSGAWYTVGRGRNQQFAFTLLSKAVTGGTVNLTSTEAANVVQNYTGALISNCNIVFPSVVQVYYVRNNTTGAFTTTFKTAGVGTTITIPQGQAAVLFCDGLNVVNSATSVGGITALTLSQGAVGSPSINYSGDTTTGIYQPAGGQVAVSSVGVQVGLFTGTGLNATAIGATTPAAGTFTNLGFTGQMPAPLGAVGAPSYSFLGDLNTGGWSPGADTMAWSVAGAEGMRLTTTGLGVGGTPTTKLDVNGTITVRGNIGAASSAGAYSLGSDPSFTNGGMVQVWGSTSGSPNIVTVVTANTERLRVDASGNVGINKVPTAGYQLDVSGTIRSQGGEASAAGYGVRVINAANNGGGALTAPTGASGGLALSSDSGPLKISANGVTNIAQFGGGSASGLEILSASNSLVLRQTSSSGYAGVRIYNDQNSAVRALEIDYTGSAYASGLTSGPTGEQGNVVTTGNFPLVFGTNNTARMQITGAGVIQDAIGNELGFKDLPFGAGKSAPYTVLSTDRGSAIVMNTASNVTIPTGLPQFSVIVIYNNSGSALTIVQGGGATLRLEGTATTGNRTLAANGKAVLWCFSPPTYSIGGTGLT